MKNFFKIVLRHKIYSLIIVAVLIGGGYWGYGKWFGPAPTVKYVTSKVTRGALATVVSGTGQVSALSQVDLKSDASGKVVYVGAKAGDEVKAGAVLVSLDATDALNSVRDSESSLVSAQLALEKLQAPVDALSLLQSENSLTQAMESKQNAIDSLSKSYEDGFNTVSNAFLEIPNIVSGLHNLLFGANFSPVQSNIDWYDNVGTSYSNDGGTKISQYYNEVTQSYDKAKKAFDLSYNNFKISSRFSATSTIENLISETYEATKLIAEAVKDVNNYLDFIQDAMSNYAYEIATPALMTTHQNSLETYIGTTNSNLLSLLSIKNTITNSKNTIISSERTIAEKTVSLADLKAGTDPLDIRSQKLVIQQKQDALQSAKTNLAKYSVRAPFAGVLATFTAKKGDTASSGSSLGTLITKQRIATISLNEVDVAKVKVGQKATITFDAIEDLSITGEVVEVDALGTTSQGVVSYNVKIAFDVQDARVKPGMSVSVNVILSTKPNVLMAPSSAIKIQNGESYVEVLVGGASEQKTIVAGDSNDTMTEITSGLNEGEDVITQTISSTNVSTVTTQSTTNNRQVGGFGGGSFNPLR